ncbi:HutD family protein [Sphingomonas sp. JC676]|nr:HutD family protein [Sphingomonas sp. JC676]
MTTGVAAWPVGAFLDGFDWRISLARVDRDGPFSTFLGVTRTQLLLSGGPITLVGPNWKAELAEGSDPVTFDGRDAVEASARSPATVLNVMTRRAVYTHSLQSLELAEPVDIAAEAAEHVLIALDDGVTTDALTLGVLDALWLSPGDTVTLAPIAPARILSITLCPTS